jgi:aminodeoxyfutalosine synthase
MIQLKHTDKKIEEIADKVISGERITKDDGLYLYNNAELGLLSVLADNVRRRINGTNTYFNKNIHIEPTNICIYSCDFCSYKRKINEEGSWESSKEDILNKVTEANEKGITEVHIVGGVHPKWNLEYFGDIIADIKKINSNIHIKAFTAVELEHMIKKSGYSIDEGLLKLKEYGLDSIPGGGAEIFDTEVREKICDQKTTSDMWIDMHRRAHKAGIPSNATMLYGHIENYSNRINHLNTLRELQDETSGFNTFIPLKYKKANNSMSHLGEVSVIEDLKNYAISRIFLDNIPHIKAYWPMIGKNTTQLSLAFGVDDVDGTIDDSTKIYSMAGAEDQNPKMTTDQLVEMIQKAGYKAIERDTVYNIIKEY